MIDNTGGFVQEIGAYAARVDLVVHRGLFFLTPGHQAQQLGDYQTRSIDSQAAMVMAWEVIGKLPADACPYSRPFPKDFADCTAFQPVEFIAVSSSDVPAQPITSCANLTIGTFSDGATHRYARCQLGDSVARLGLLKSQVVVSESYVLTHADPDDADLAPPPIMPPR